jgi:predicted lipid-binding transport protein (Tim44 family)
MSDQIDLTTIVFALVAAFVVWKMRAILGSRNQSTIGSPPRVESSSTTTKIEPDANSDTTSSGEHARWMPFAKFGSEMWQRLDEISRIDPTFNPREFIDGAKLAYEFILRSFSTGDIAALTPLLEKEVFESFSAAISDRRKNGTQLETTLVSLDRSEIQEINIEEKVAQIVVRFESKIITVTKDESGIIVEGSQGKVADVVDVWTFQRDLNSSDPNWRLISTEDPH